MADGFWAGALDIAAAPGHKTEERHPVMLTAPLTADASRM